MIPHRNMLQLSLAKPLAAARSPAVSHTRSQEFPNRLLLGHVDAVHRFQRDPLHALQR
jgi:hypothetical protein